MLKRYVLCLLGANHTGIMAAVATALSELGGEIHKISQTVTENLFTIVMAADFPEHRDPQVIVGHLEGVCRSFGVQVILKDPLQEALPDDHRPASVERCILTLTGRDAPGIVAKISGRLAREGVDITEFHGERTGGGQSFRMTLEVEVPCGVDAVLLRSDLESLGAPIGMSVTLERKT